MHLVFSKLLVTEEPKSFQFIPVESSAPSLSNSEQLLMDNLSIILVGGDDKGQDTAVKYELHHLVLIVIGVEVGLDNWLQNRFIRNVAAGKADQSSSCLIQP